MQKEKPIMDNTISRKTEDFKYSVHNGEVTIDRYIGNNTTIVIPSEIDGITVKSIGSYAFYDCTSLKSIEIPDVITSIGDSAFRGCTHLESVTLGGGLEKIGSESFRSCWRLKSIEIPDGVTSIGDSAFRGCTHLESVTLGESLEKIGAFAFYDCQSLEAACYVNFVSIEVPESLDIGVLAFPSRLMFKPKKERKASDIFNRSAIKAHAEKIRETARESPVQTKFIQKKETIMENTIDRDIYPDYPTKEEIEKYHLEEVELSPEEKGAMDIRNKEKMSIEDDIAEFDRQAAEAEISKPSERLENYKYTTADTVVSRTVEKVTSELAENSNIKNVTDMVLEKANDTISEEQKENSLKNEREEKYNPLKSAEMSSEDNLNMIDGIPNNTTPKDQSDKEKISSKSEKGQQMLAGIFGRKATIERAKKIHNNPSERSAPVKNKNKNNELG